MLLNRFDISLQKIQMYSNTKNLSWCHTSFFSKFGCNFCHNGLFLTILFYISWNLTNPPKISLLSIWNSIWINFGQNVQGGGFFNIWENFVLPLLLKIVQNQGYEARLSRYHLNVYDSRAIFYPNSIYCSYMVVTIINPSSFFCFREWSKYSASLHGFIHSWKEYKNSRVLPRFLMSNHDLLMKEEATRISQGSRPTIRDVFQENDDDLIFQNRFTPSFYRIQN